MTVKADSQPAMPSAAAQVTHEAAQGRSSGETPMSTSSDTAFTGTRALVTGGTRGIGEAIVQSPRGAAGRHWWPG